MNTKVILVEPRGSSANVFASFMKLPLLGPLYLGSLLKSRGYDVRIFNENILGRDLTAEELDADVLCLSLLTPSSERGFALAREFKARRPKSRVIIGGVHGTFSPEETAAYADHVVTGEGVNILPDLIRYGSSEAIVHGTPTMKLDDLPMPDLDLLARNRPMNKTPILTSLGCPFHCTFCSVTQMFGHKYRVTSVDRTMEELRRVTTPSVFFYDDNFAADKRRLHAICDRILSENLKFTWTAQMRTDVARDRDLVAKMGRSGCTHAYIGFESVNPDTLIAYEKRQSVEEIESSIRILHENGISIHGMFVLGSDTDDPSIFSTTRAFCRTHRIDSVQFMILTPLPGTETFRKLEREGRILHRRWQYYDGMHAVFTPKNMTALQLQEGMVATYEDFYSLMGAADEALAAAANKAGRLVRALSARARHATLNNAIIKVAGHSIVRRWLRLNAGYLSYLRSPSGDPVRP